MVKRRYLFILLLLLSGISLFLGVSTVNLQGLLAFDSAQWQIFLISRVPRLVSILIAGASLSICGLVMQQLSRNRFVSPTTAGTMDSARLGNCGNGVIDHHCFCGGDSLSRADYP
ncbi:iron chelate uptake ABC transporter family permease subunit [Avibacterium gallinarum]|uniref:FecCD transport family protein n=1 Tax=Avibacterium gallinarum TaxID=755 RepID=A0A379AUW7_AVIGA|nr:iron chelate uptake ABC transporter family permease subunit [Avibacterium gallinarum]TDP27659.1 FecCD transport family protein [Avibacterium gallinarum]SUB26115.1 iron-hydroxamate transporter permease subunit [Avibacterium gallinarum]